MSGRKSFTARLTRQMALEELEQVHDGGGGSNESWRVVSTIWAELEARSARERSIAGGARSFVSHRATVRWAPAGDPSRPNARQRLREGDRVFSIVGVSEPDDERRTLQCWLSEEEPA